jgi:hypothetical protein
MSDIASDRELVLADAPLQFLVLDSTDLLTDVSGNGRNGTAVGGVIIGGAAGPGDSFGATNLDGVDDRVTSTYNPFTNGTARTFFGWARRDTHGALMALVAGNNAGTCPRLLMSAASPATLTWEPDRSTGTTSTWTSGPVDLAWFSWMLLFNEATDTANLLINGVSLGVRTNTTPYNASPGNIQWGVAQTSAFPFDGQISHVGVVDGDITSRALDYYNWGLSTAASRRPSFGLPSATNFPSPANLPTGETLGTP